MPFTTEQLAFIGIFAEKLRAKVDTDNIPLAEKQEHIIAEEFATALVEFKERLASQHAYHAIHGEMAWSAEKANIIDAFAQQLDKIFKPVGGLNPGEASAYWSGSAVKRASEVGVDFASTIPGFVVNQVSASLQEVFTKKAYTPDGELDTAVNVGMWDAMSALYAQGTRANAHVFLVDGETSSQSIFWNTELHTLRERQASGEVEGIYVHTLTSKALLDYQLLLAQKKTLDPQNTSALQTINQHIDTLLKNASSWKEMGLEEASEVLKLKVSGFSESHKAVHYQTMKDATQRFKKALHPEKKQPHDVALTASAGKPVDKSSEKHIVDNDVAGAFRHMLNDVRHKAKDNASPQDKKDSHHQPEPSVKNRM